MSLSPTKAHHALDIPEILQWILSSSRQTLDSEDLLSTSLVNKTWYQASKRAQWERVELDSDSWIDPYHQALAAQLSKYGHFVQTLVLKECVSDDSQLEALLPSMIHLQSIIVDKVSLYNRSSSLLHSLELLPMTHLRHLCLPHVSTTSGRIDLLLRICESNNHQLRHLELLDSEIDDDILAVIARTCPSLKTLDLSRNEVISFKDFPNATTLGVSGTTTTTASESGYLASSRFDPYSQQHVAERYDATSDSDDTLGEELPFMHLKELNLVFCFGIANAEFQTLFRSFRNKSLRSLNLQFTNIEDSGLEALAFNLGYRLTSVSVSYCNRITARGIRAIVDPNRCPRLLELEFLSCDLVSAECFRSPQPWGCRRLRRLEFTFHPRVAIARMERERVAAAEEEERERNLLEAPIAVDVGTSNASLVVPQDQDQDQIQQGQAQQQQHQQQQHQQASTHTNVQDKQTLSQDNVSTAEESPVQGQCPDDLWLEEQGSVRGDYYALFRQLKRLTDLRYLNIYNSPALNSTFTGDYSHDKETTVPLEVPDSIDESDSVVPPHDTTTTTPSQEYWSHSMEDMDGSSTSGSDFSMSASRLEHRRYSFAYEDEQGSSQEGESEGRAIVSSDLVTMAPGVTEPSDQRQETPEASLTSSEPESIHPFSLRMGLKALGRLTQLESLTFYERSSITFGQAEVRWISKHFPLLSTLQLRGSIDVPDQAVQQLAARRPGIHLQVCSLFE
ncbi:hypothetical protein BGX33_003822 [Mortierella sp. NVP41]|nr:hypothetical protein BGX33_003822 [Mortierella sp. NVP41]